VESGWIINRDLGKWFWSWWIIGEEVADHQWRAEGSLVESWWSIGGDLMDQ